MKNKINWAIRWQNKTWVAGFIAQTFLVIQGIIFALEGMHAIDIDMETANLWVKSLTVICDLILGYFAYLGIVIDPTVEGVGDSARALNRVKPLPEEIKDDKYYKY